MNPEWPTKEKDLLMASQILEHYAFQHKSQKLDLFEIIVDTEKKRMEFQLASWVNY